MAWENESENDIKCVIVYDSEYMIYVHCIQN